MNGCTTSRRFSYPVLKAVELVSGLRICQSVDQSSTSHEIIVSHKTVSRKPPAQSFDKESDTN